MSDERVSLELIEQKPLTAVLTDRLRIIVLELERLWSYWLGLPIKPRSWTLSLPAFDEL